MKVLATRYKYLAILVLIIILGLLSRKYNGPLTGLIDLKDVIWAMMVYFLVRLIFMDWSILAVAIAGLAFSILIEVSQLYHAEWIDKLRNTFLGSIILGSAFVWKDLAAYLTGIIAGVLIDYLLLAKKLYNKKGSPD